MKKTIMFLNILLITAHIWGLNLEPLSMTFSPSGKDSIQTFRISNTQKQSIAVRISMTTRELKSDGTETRLSADDDFTVFPKSMFLAPGKSQAVRIQWKGPSVLQKEAAYRIIAEQVPVQEKKETENNVSLNFLYKYVGAVYVTPGNAEENIVFAGYVRPGTDKIAIKFENRGNTHAIVKNADIKLTALKKDGSTERYAVDYSELKVLAGANFLSGASLIEIIELPPSMHKQKIEVEYSFETIQ